MLSDEDRVRDAFDRMDEGTRQKVLLEMALIVEGFSLVLDAECAAADPETVAEYRRRIDALRKSFGAHLDPN